MILVSNDYNNPDTAAITDTNTSDFWTDFLAGVDTIGKTFESGKELYENVFGDQNKNQNTTQDTTGSGLFNTDQFTEFIKPGNNDLLKIAVIAAGVLIVVLLTRK